VLREKEMDLSAFGRSKQVEIVELQHMINRLKQDNDELQ